MRKQLAEWLPPVRSWLKPAGATLNPVKLLFVAPGNIASAFAAAAAMVSSGTGRATA